MRRSSTDDVFFDSTILLLIRSLTNKVIDYITAVDKAALQHADCARLLDIRTNSQYCLNSATGENISTQRST